MRPWIRLLIAVVILAAVVGVLYWPHKPTATVAAAPLVTVNPAQVRQITITQPNQPQVELSLAGASWTLVQPYRFAADQAAVSSLIDSLGHITDTEEIGPGTNLTPFGLDRPSTVTLTMASGPALDFEFGGNAPNNENCYLRMGPSGPVEMVTSAIRDTVLENAFALQDKTVLSFPSASVTGVDVAAGGKKLHLEQVNNAWPKAQQDDVQAMLDALSDAQMATMVDATGKTTSAEGLANPAVTLKLSWNGGSSQLDVGGKQGSTDYYARNSSSPAVFTLASYVVDDITKLLQPPAPAAVTPTK